jgi:hypothetical protein
VQTPAETGKGLSDENLYALDADEHFCLRFVLSGASQSQVTARGRASFTAN